MLGRLPPFDYYRPSTLQETLAIINRLDGFCLFGGGTDLLVAMKEKRGAHPPLVDVKHIPGICNIQPENGGLKVGGGACTRVIARSPLVRERFPLLSDALTILGSIQIGNRATIGGNLCNGSPAADSAPALLSLAASVKLVGPQAERRVPLEEFFVGPKKTVLNRELLVEIHIPAAPPLGRSFFYKLGPRGAPEDICIVSVGIFAVADDSAKNWKDARISLGAVAPTPIRARQAEEALRDRPISASAIDDAARLAAEKDGQPITDIRGSADYRRAMVRVLVKRGLEQIAAGIKETARS
ncbi:MAG: xanthine dehydrogenase family protein subunit M [Deltaproteobacteria bacterium]|nr:xanthine dehydrogenase family protein subunit M [Deltaproteobacteria bacterium]